MVLKRVEMSSEQNSGCFSPFSAFCLVLCLMAVMVGGFLKTMGSEVKPSGKPFQEAGEDDSVVNSVVFGPYKLDQTGRIYDIQIRYGGPMNNDYLYCDIELLDSEKDPVASYRHEFWHESGRDSEGSWSEADRKVTQKVVLGDAGEYYISVTGEKSRKFLQWEQQLKAQGKPEPGMALKPEMFQLKVYEGVFHVSMLWWVAAVAAIYPGLALFFTASDS